MTNCSHQSRHLSSFQMIPMILSQLVADADLRAKYSDEHYEEEVEELFREKFSNNLQVRERMKERERN